MTKKTWRRAKVQDRSGYVIFEVLEDDEVIRRVLLPDGPLKWPEEE